MAGRGLCEARAPTLEQPKAGEATSRQSSDNVAASSHNFGLAVAADPRLPAVA